MERQGIKATMIDSYLALAVYQKSGGPTERVSESVREVLDREPRSIQDFAMDYRESFKQIPFFGIFEKRI